MLRPPLFFSYLAVAGARTSLYVCWLVLCLVLLIDINSAFWKLNGVMAPVVL